MISALPTPSLPLSVALQGLALSFGLIVAIGAQNAFVLRQGQALQGDGEGARQRERRGRQYGNHVRSLPALANVDKLSFLHSM